LSIYSLDSLVIDEADLILSYGHNEDIRSIFGGNFLPKVFQSFLMSATMTEDVEILKGLALRSPVCIYIVLEGSALNENTGYSQTGRRRG
jgi:ATP-dependent RNA helicase DDX56/DBP9